jgi:hypothetical protein
VANLRSTPATNHTHSGRAQPTPWHAPSPPSHTPRTHQQPKSDPKTSYNPDGCRATYPAVDRIPGPQREPSDARPLVSYRRPLMTMNACEGFA